jgi:CheY-like chemotaxis protein
MKVLVVDDDPQVRTVLRAMLETCATVTAFREAVNGVAAVGEAESFLPDVVTMDLVMPFMDGWEATRLIKEALPETRVILFTASESPTSADEVAAAGAEAWFSKSDLSALVNYLGC